MSVLFVIGRGCLVSAAVGSKPGSSYGTGSRCAAVNGVVSAGPVVSAVNKGVCSLMYHHVKCCYCMECHL
jgi:hypothetical protein